MGVINYARARKLYAPACKPNVREGAQEAWDAHQAVMKHHRYELRSKDTGARNCRDATGQPGKKSMHAFFIDCVITLWNLGKSIAGALSCDFNWQTNPYGSRLITDMPREMVEDILAIRTKNGVRVFAWGGYWSGNKDAMHYDIVCEPSDLATGIDWSTVRRDAEDSKPTPEPEEEDMTRPYHLFNILNVDGINPAAVWHMDGGASSLRLVQTEQELLGLYGLLASQKVPDPHWVRKVKPGEDLYALVEAVGRRVNGFTK